MELVSLLQERIRLYYPEHLARNLSGKISAHVLRQVSDADIADLDPLQLNELADMVYEDYERSRVEPGRMVGVIAAQTMGEVQTQATLNTHRNAGLSVGRESFSGLARLVQIYENSKPSQPAMFLYPKERHTIYDIKRLMTRIQYTIINDLLADAIVAKYDSPSVARLPFHAVYESRYGVLPKTDYVLRMQFDVQKMYDKRITLSSIAALIRDAVRDARVAYSEYARGIIDVYYTGTDILENYLPITTMGEATYYFIRDQVMPTIKGIRVSGLEGIDAVFPNSIQLSEIVSDISNTGTTSDGHFIYSLRLDKKAMRVTGIKVEWVREWILEMLYGTDSSFMANGDLRTDMNKDSLMNKIYTQDVPLSALLTPDGQINMQRISLHGLQMSSVVSRIQALYPSAVDAGGNYIPNTIPVEELDQVSFPSSYRRMLGEYWFIETRGINMEDVQFMLEFNPNCTWCNSGKKMNKLYGIESNRRWIFTESVDAGAASIAYEFNSLLCDTATHDGRVYGMNEKGIGRMNLDFMTRSNFENNTTNFIESALIGRTDTLSGVSASVLTGNLAQAGTNFSEVVYDPTNVDAMERRSKPPKAPKLSRGSKQRA